MMLVTVRVTNCLLLGMGLLLFSVAEERLEIMLRDWA